MNELKLALRSLARSPGFTIVAVVTLALGIGANTAIFTLIQGVLLQPLPYEEPERLVRFWSTWDGFPRGSISEPEYFDYLDQNQVFQEIAVYRGRDQNLMSGDGEPRRVVVKSVTGEFFPLLRRGAFLGRTLSPADDEPGADPVVVASYGFWQTTLGGQRDAIGAVVDLEGERYTVVGVMPSEFTYPEKNTDLWRTMRLDRTSLLNRGAHNYSGIARLAPGVSLERAQADMSAIAARLQERYPENYPDGSGWGVTLVPLYEHTVGAARPALAVLWVAVILVLLIACANVANLSLVRATARDKELRLRSVLGAGRARLVRGLVAESVVVAGLGLLAGLAIALLTLRALQAAFPDSVPRLEEASIDAHVLAFTIAVSMFTVVLVGLVPALRVSRTSLIGRESSRVSAGRAHNRLRSVLVVVQVSLAVLLLVVAGLLIRSFQQLLRVEPGFEPESVIAMEVSASQNRYPEREQRANFFHEVVRELEAVPGVVASGAITNPPLSGWTNDNYVEVEGYIPEAGYVTEEVRGVTPHYFAAMGIPLLQGEVFTGLETRQSAPVVIVDEAFAKKFWDGETPIGKRLRSDTDRPFARVIGVVGNIRHVGLDEPVRPTYYYPLALQVHDSMTVVTRSSRDPESIASVLRQAVARVDPTQPVYNVRLYQQFIDDSIATPRFNLMLLFVFASVAILLASVGIYGVLAYTVGQRTQEIGIRMALGAQARKVPWLILRQGLVWIGIGLALGFTAALALTRVMESLLFGVGARDPVTFVAVAVVLSAVAVAACLLPARRAARVDPMVALRYE